MSTTTDTHERADIAVDESFPDDLWHLPVDDLHDFRAATGLSWLTPCGQMRPPARESKSPFFEAPDDCLVCVGLDAAS